MFVDLTLMVTIDLDNHHHRNLVVLGEETIKTVLKSAGLTEKEAVIYIFLAKNEPLKGTEIAKLSKKDKAHVFRILKKLQAKGFVEATLEFPARYTVVPFETVLESVVKAKREEVNFIEKAKKDLIDQLRKKSQIDQSLEKFVVVKGKKRIHSKIFKMFQNTKNQILVAMSVSSLIQVDRYGVFDAFMKRRLNPKTKHRFLTELSEENLNSMKALLKKMPKTEINFKAINPEQGAGFFPRVIIRDNEELLFFTSTLRIGSPSKEEVCLWTNSKSLVQTFTGMFDEIWRNSTDVQAKISEIETGKPPVSICIISDVEKARMKYKEILQSAKEEIVLMTSSQNLVGQWKNRARFKDWSEKGVHVKIMSPIVGENLETAKQISQIFPVKHIPLGFPEATIIDGKHYFQFKTPPPTKKEKLSPTPNFENTFYTNDLQYVNKMKNMFDELWKKSFAPSPLTLEAILERSRRSQKLPSSDMKPSYFKKVSGLSFKDRKQTATATEKVVLDKIIDTETLSSKIQPKSPMRLHGSTGNAVIHPPSHFNLPEMVITVFHIEKHSSFGEEDAMLVYMWLETSKGSAYVPVAIVGDNPKGQTIWKVMMAGTPAGQNTQLFKKNELQVRIHGNTLFAGWTRQIPLLPEKRSLPPACLLIEGYGDLKTDSFTLFFPSGYKSVVERYGCEAFVTFFHPSSKYSGPGTDGFFARDYVATTYPPTSE